MRIEDLNAQNFEAATLQKRAQFVRRIEKEMLTRVKLHGFEIFPVAAHYVLERGEVVSAVSAVWGGDDKDSTLTQICMGGRDQALRPGHVFDHFPHQQTVERPRVPVFHEVALDEIDRALGLLALGVAQKIVEEIHSGYLVAALGEHQREISGGASNVGHLGGRRQEIPECREYLMHAKMVGKRAWLARTWMKELASVIAMAKLALELVFAFFDRRKAHFQRN